MNADEYAVRQAVISAAIVNYVLGFGKFFTRPALSIKDWLSLLGILFPEIKQRREESAALAREFYDSQRGLHHPDLARQDRFLEGTDFQHFVQSMEPARARMSLADSPDHAVGQLALQAVREVENAGRRQIIHSVEEDEAPMPVKGWARVATGRETCAWCLMLISRGPIYMGADTAGLDLPDDEVAELFKKAGGDLAQFHEFTSDYMEEWHPGCDCKVVPVYKYEDWPGHDEWKKAEKLWISASKEADGLLESGESRTTNRNKETLNALRRRLDRGEVDMSEFAAAAA